MIVIEGIVIPDVAREGILCLFGKVLVAHGWVWHFTRPFVVHDSFEGYKCCGDKAQHQNDAQYDNTLADLATSWAAELEIVTPSRLLVVPFAFTLGDVRGHCCPCTQPKDDG